MSDTTATLHMLCGKIAAGKSTLAAKLAAVPGTVLISEDVWLSALFGDQMTTSRDFLHFSGRLREILGPHIASLLDSGVSVVLDFQANTLESRKWMRGVLDQTHADHQLHVLVPPDEVCLARLRARNASGSHPFQVSEVDFYQVSKYFVRPAEDEGFTLVIHDQVI